MITLMDPIFFFYCLTRILCPIFVDLRIQNLTQYKGKMYTVVELKFCRGKVYGVGGFNGSLRVRTVDVYEPATDTWTSIASMEARR